MSQRRILLIGAAAAAFLLVPAAQARPLPLVFGPWEQFTLDDPVEQQTPGGETQPDQSLWVVNPTGCVWDADDMQSAGATNRYLDAGTSAAVSKCQVMDWLGHFWHWDVRAPSADLRVTLTLFGRSFAASPELTAEGYRYVGCASVETDNDYPLPPVEGSNGGVGILGEATLTVENPTDRTVRKIGAFVRTNLATRGSCPAEPQRDGVFPGPFYSWSVTG